MPVQSSTSGRATYTKKHKKSKHPQVPQTAEEFLAVGVEHEESAEKWRAGDAAKSVRFFDRALEAYEAGLRKFPGSFDLSYNRARVQFQLTQYPALLAQVPTPKLELLSVALASHRHALEINSTNADALFNTAQVLIVVAEEQLDEATSGSTSSPGTHRSAGESLREALALLDRCLGLQEAWYAQQEAEFKEFQASVDGKDDENGGVALNSSSEVNATDGEQSDEVAEESNDTDQEASGQWASIVEPVTKSSLVDCVLAILQALTSLCDVDASDRDVSLDQLEGLVQSMIQIKLPLYVEHDLELDAFSEVAVTTARTKTALLGVRFREAQIDWKSYDVELRQIFENPPQQVAERAEWSCTFAEALVEFADEIRESPGTATTRWTRLAKALELFTQASKQPDANNVPSIHVSRGNVELMRHLLTHNQELPESINNEQVRRRLLTNAHTFYKGATNVAAAESRQSDLDILHSASIRREVAFAILENDPGPLRQLPAQGVSAAVIAREIRLMETESLISKDVLESLLAL